MHIPKTAGTAIGDALALALGPENCRLQSGTINDADFATHRFIAGHLVLSTITRNAFRFTFLRDPIRQIASHLRWLDRYNNPIFAEEADAFEPEFRTIFRRIGETDFASAASLDAFFRWLPADAPVRIANVQCQCLAARFDRIDYRNDEELGDVAIAHLPHVDFVGVVEFIRRDMRKLFRRLDLGPLPPLELRNTLSSNRRLNHEDKAIRAVLASQMQADLRLFEWVTRPRWRDLLPRR